MKTKSWHIERGALSLRLKITGLCGGGKKDTSFYILLRCVGSQWSERDATARILGSLVAMAEY